MARKGAPDPAQRCSAMTGRPRASVAMTSRWTVERRKSAAGTARRLRCRCRWNSPANGRLRKPPASSMPMSFAECVSFGYGDGEAAGLLKCRRASGGDFRAGGPAEALNATADFQRFRPILARAAKETPGCQGRQALDDVQEHRMPALQCFRVVVGCRSKRPGRRRGTCRAGCAFRARHRAAARVVDIFGISGRRRSMRAGWTPRSRSWVDDRRRGRHRHAGLPPQILHRQGKEKRDPAAQDRRGCRRPWTMHGCRSA